MLQVTQQVSLLLKKRVNIVTDREFALEGIFLNGRQLFCWNHLLWDLCCYLKGPGNCTSKQDNYFVNIFRSLMSNGETEVEFDRQWHSYKESNEFTTMSKVLSYFKRTLLPVFKEHSSIWRLRDAGIQNRLSESPITILQCSFA